MLKLNSALVSVLIFLALRTSCLMSANSNESSGTLRTPNQSRFLHVLHCATWLYALIAGMSATRSLLHGCPSHVGRTPRLVRSFAILNNHHVSYTEGICKGSVRRLFEPYREGSCCWSTSEPWSIASMTRLTSRRQVATSESISPSTYS